MKKRPRKTYTRREDVERSSPEELTELLFRKAQTNPEGWTASAAVGVNLAYLEERKELQRVHRSGRRKGAFGRARNVVERLAPSCATFDELLAAMRRETGPEREVAEIDEDNEVVAFDEKGRLKEVSFKSLRDYFREAKRGK